MKTICVNRNVFNKSVGYGFWLFVSIGMLFMIFASTSEIPTIKEIENESKMRYDNTVCYINYFEGEKCVGIISWLYGVTPIDTQYSFIFGYIVNLIVIGCWIYYKQQKVKFSFCEKGLQSTASESRK